VNHSNPWQVAAQGENGRLSPQVTYSERRKFVSPSL